MALGRTLPGNVSTEIDNQHTKPFYIVKMEFAGGTQYRSEAQQVSYGGQTYLAGNVKVGQFSHNSDAGQSGSISLLNENDYAADLGLDETVQDVPIEIYLVYSTGPSTNTDPVLYVRGYLSGATITPAETTFAVMTSRATTEFVPSKFHTIEEGFNWLPPSGLIVQWNGEKYMIEGDK